MTAAIARLAVAAALLAPCAAPAFAQDAPAAVAGGVPPRVDATFRQWDGNRDGALSLQEFRGGWAALRRDGIRRAQRARFDRLDGNHDGAIDAGEYGELLLVERAGTSAPPLAAFDASRNGRLEFAEYQGLVRRLAPAARRPAAPDAGAPASRENTK